MVELGQNMDLATQRPKRMHIDGTRSVNGLHRAALPRLFVDGLVDLPHAPSAKRSDDSKRADFGEFRHAETLPRCSSPVLMLRKLGVSASSCGFLIIRAPSRVSRRW